MAHKASPTDTAVTGLSQMHHKVATGRNLMHRKVATGRNLQITNLAATP